MMPPQEGVLHQGENVARVQHDLLAFMSDLFAGAAYAGIVRRDAPSDELARYSLHALGAASSLSSKAAVRRLVEVTISGLQPRLRSRVDRLHHGWMAPRVYELIPRHARPSNRWLIPGAVTPLRTIRGLGGPQHLHALAVAETFKVRGDDGLNRGQLGRCRGLSN